MRLNRLAVCGSALLAIASAALWGRTTRVNDTWEWTRRRVANRWITSPGSVCYSRRIDHTAAAAVANGMTFRATPYDVPQRSADGSTMTFRARPFPGSSAGFECSHEQYAIDPKETRWTMLLPRSANNLPGYEYYTVRVPLWLPCVALSIAPVVGGARAWRSRRRRRVGRCPSCGYDLRGSTERCPECGRVTVGHGRTTTAAPAGIAQAS